MPFYDLKIFFMLLFKVDTLLKPGTMMRQAPSGKRFRVLASLGVPGVQMKKIQQVNVILLLYPPWPSG